MTPTLSGTVDEMTLWWSMAIYSATTLSGQEPTLDYFQSGHVKLIKIWLIGIPSSYFSFHLSQASL